MNRLSFPLVVARADASLISRIGFESAMPAAWSIRKVSTYTVIIRGQVGV